jgi:hypothetical protein
MLLLVGAAVVAKVEVATLGTSMLVLARNFGVLRRVEILTGDPRRCVRANELWITKVAVFASPHHLDFRFACRATRDLGTMLLSV